MRNNRALSRAAGSLIHPLTLAAIVILLINDHILRWLWPSWIWGKLGDFSWLVFFPFIPALILSFIVPKRWKNQEALVAGLSFASTGLVFSLMNTIPAAHAAGLHLIQTILNAPFILRLDPTDLFALPGLLIGWHIWQQVKPTRQFKIAQAYPILVLGALASIATSPPPPSGIECLYQQNDGTIIATIPHYTYNSFESRDGGLTWQRIEEDEADMNRCIERDMNADWVISNPGNGQIQYWISPEKKVYISSDGGNDWQLELDLSASEAQIAYYKNIQSYWYFFTTGPLDALVDGDTGNLILAMGIEGILTRTPEGELLWFEDASSYDRISMHSSELVLPLLRVEFGLAVVLFFMVGGFASLWISPPRGFWQFMISVATLAWIGITVSSPVLNDNRVVLIVYGMYLSPIWLLMVIAFLVGFDAVIKQYKGDSGRIITSSLVASILYLLPYILWSQNIIHKYIVAMIAALVLASGSASISVANLIKHHKAIAEEVEA